MRTLCPHIAFHSFLVPHLCVPKLVVSFHLSRAMSLAPHRTPSTSSSTFSSVPGLQRLLTSRISCADPRERGGDGYTLIQNLSQVMSPTSLLNRRILPALKTIRLPKLRVMSKLFPFNQSLLSSTQDSIESIATPQEADLDDEQIRSLRLHHGTYRSEKQVRNDRKVITLKENA